MGERAVPWRVVFLCILFFVWGQQSLTAGSLVPAPSWLKLVKIADKMVRNGLPATVYTFSTTKKPGEVLQFYRDYWRDRGGSMNSVREAGIPPWKIMSHFENRLLYTLQVRPVNQSGATGYLAVSEPDKIKRTGGKGKIPSLVGSTITNALEFYDSGRKSQMFQVENSFSLERNSEFYRQFFREQGWTVLLDKAEDSSRVLALTRKNMEANVVINHHADVTRIIINIIEPR